LKPDDFQAWAVFDGVQSNTLGLTFKK